MPYLTHDDWPEGAKSCPKCDTGYYLEPWKQCYLCAHPEIRNTGTYQMDREEDALFSMAFNHGSQD